MDEKFPQKNIETNREKLIKAQASLDAYEYINLMRKKSPESLEFDSSGELVLNVSDGKKIFKSAEVRISLTMEEKMKYFENLLDAVKKILPK
jgi:hypothetical protein